MKAAGLKLACCIFAALVVAGSVAAYDPPRGSVYYPALTSPGGLVASGGPAGSGTGGEFDLFSSPNPAWQSFYRLKRLDASYLGLTDFGASAQGWGSAASASFTLPLPYAVWGFGLRFVSLPSSMTDLSFGTFGEGRVSIAKQVFPNFSLGAGLSAQGGGNGSFGWGAGLDLGFRHDIATRGFIKGITWGMSLTNIGKGFSYAIPVPPTGTFGTAATPITTPFTIGLEGRAYLVKTENWRIGLGLGLSTPAFGDLNVNADLGIAFRDIVSLGIGWDGGLRDILSGTTRSYLPSAGLSVTIPLGDNPKPGSIGSISTAAVYAPLYGDVVAVGGGAGITFGKPDRSPPKVLLRLADGGSNPYYLSPNGDGVQDKLVIDLEVRDGGNLRGYSFRIEDKAAGKTIKKNEPELGLPSASTGLSGLIDGFKYVRSSLPIPPQLVWNGYTDEGQKAPNGAYLVSFEVWDEEGNRNSDYINWLTVVVDNDAPKVSVSGLDRNRIFSPDGDGIRENMEFRLGGSVEKLWKLELKNANGTVVRTENWPDQSPPDFVWDGTDDKGKVVPDGIYSLHLSASKASGFAAAQTTEGIVVDTRRPPVSLDLAGNIMSPNGDGRKDSIQIRTKLESKAGLEKYRVFVLDSDRKEVWSDSGSDPSRLRDTYIFTGKDAAGKALPDGVYEAGISLEYINGYSPQKFSPPIVLDSTPPAAILAITDPNRIFSPDGDGSRDSFAFVVSGSREDLWRLAVRNEAGLDVRTVEFRDSEPVEFIWDGRDDKGKILPDGIYSVELKSTDRADNPARFAAGPVHIDNRRPALKMLIDWSDFSPNGDGIRDTVRLVPSVESKDGLVSWKVLVSDKSGAEVWSVSGSDPSALKDKYDFDGIGTADGKLLPEGGYGARTELVYASGYMPKASTPAFNLDATYPEISLKTDDPNTAFSPDGDGIRDSLSFTIRGSREDLWTLEIRGEDGSLARLVEFRDREPESFVWDGKDNFGKIVADGKYTLSISAKDKAENASKPAEAAIRLDTRRPGLKLDLARMAFSPNEDGVLDTLSLAPKLELGEGILSWKLWVRDSANREMWSVSGDGSSLPSASYILLGGRDRAAAGGLWPDGEYRAKLEITYAAGHAPSAETPAFLLDSLYPEARLAEKEPGRVFSPDGDGVRDVKSYAISGSKEELWTLEVKGAAGQVLRSQEYRDASPADFVWDGRTNAGALAPDGEYRVELRSEDRAGNALKLVSQAVKIDTRKPVVALSVSQDAFSPNGDGIRDGADLTVKVAQRDGLSTWKIRIVGKTENTVWSREGSGSQTLAEKYALDGKVSVTGKESEGTALWPEGEYRAIIELGYESGYALKVETPWFLMDSVFPKAALAEKEPGQVFSPDGDGVRDVKAYAIAGSKEELWTLEVKGAAGQVLRSQEYRDASPADFVWDGRTNAGALAPDGEYRVELRSEDRAGNALKLVSQAVKIDTRKPVVALSVSREAFSPNGDGIRDSADLTVKVAQRDGLATWKIRIVGKTENTVWSREGSGSRTLAEKYALDGKVSVAGKESEGTALWPEGEYRAIMELGYESGYAPKVETPWFLMDSVFPKAALAEKELGQVFSPDGDGVRDVKAYAIAGSKEELWTLEVKSAAGQVLRSQEYRDASPADFVWDGRTNAGALAPDGEYRVELRSEDRAGNALKLVSQAVKIDRRRPSVSLSVEPDAFSPNGDSVKESLNIGVNLPQKEGLESWKLSLMDKSDKEKWSANGKDPASLPANILLDSGHPESGLLASWPDGEYYAALTTSYASGYAPAVRSPVFILDRKYPQATVSSDRDSFNPSGGIGQNLVRISQKGSPEETWTGEILDSAGSVARSWKFSGEPQPVLEWDGLDRNGKLLPDGKYTYVMKSRDRAGNEFSTTPIPLAIDTEKKTLVMTSDRRAFSPNGDGVNETLTLEVRFRAAERIKSYELGIRPLGADAAASLRAVRTWKGGAGLSETYVWDGRADDGTKMPDGSYVAKLTLVYQNDDRIEALTPPLVIDTIAPSITLSASPLIFSPNGDGRSDFVGFRQRSAPGDDWTGTITSPTGSEIRIWSWRNEAGDFIWDGKDRAGNVLPDGIYRYRIVSTDPAGNAGDSGEISLQLEAGKNSIALGTERKAFSPNADGLNETLPLLVQASSPDRIKSWTLAITAQNAPGLNPGETAKTWKGGGDIGARYEWDGTTDTGSAAPDGTYNARLLVLYRNDDTFDVQTTSLVVDRLAPAARVSRAPEIFSPNGDGRSDTVAFSQTSTPGDDWTGSLRDTSGQAVRTWTWKNELKDFVWDGKSPSGAPLPDGVYTYEAVSTDSAGNSFTAGPLQVRLETEKKLVSLEVDRKYLSPNADGTNDSLPLRVRAGSPGTIKSFELSILARNLSGFAQGQPVRTWTGTTDLRDLYLWDGLSNEGRKVPDGVYDARLVVLYRNDDRFESAMSGILMDSVVPSATVSASADIFSPNGDGRSDTVTFRQTSVPGDDWTGILRDASGAAVRTLTWKNELKDLVWEGKSQSGALLPDGVYTYEAVSTDAAGNSFTSTPLAVRLETEKKLVSLELERKYLSPNADGTNDSLPLRVRAASPGNIRSFELSILALNVAGFTPGQAIRTWRGTTDLQDHYLWDGLSDERRKVPDGIYGARLIVLYRNDDRFEVAASGILMDSVAPSATVLASSDIFSPNGDGRSDTVTFRQSSVPGDDWTGILRDASGAAVRTLTWKNELKDLVWEGKSQSGALLPDGVYTYEAVSTDAAGNSFASTPLALRLETEKKQVSLEVDRKFLSPNADGKNDSLALRTRAAASERIVSYELAILSRNVATDTPGAVVRTWKGTGNLQDLYLWDGMTDDGRKAPDGVYGARLVVLYRNDDRFEVSVSGIVMDSVVPSATVSASPAIFSPNGDGRSDTVGFSQSSAPGDDWTGRMKDEAGRLVRTWTWKNALAGFVWDGKDQNGVLLPDGLYSYEVSALDPAGNGFTAGPVAVRLETEKKTVSLVADRKAFSPNGDGASDTVTLRTQAASPEKMKSWELVLQSQSVQGLASGRSVRTWKGTEGMQPQYLWDGLTDEGLKAPDGTYGARLVVLYRNDDRFEVAVSGIVMDSVVPSATVSASPAIFSPNGDGRSDTVGFAQSSVPGDDWTGRMKDEAGRLVRTWTWKNALAGFVWDGKDQNGVLLPDGLYSYEVSALDPAGNGFTAGPVAVRLETEKKTVSLVADRKAFSPNGDGASDTVTLRTQAASPEKMKSWELVVQSQSVQGLASGRSVRTWKGTEGMQSQYIWDGLTDEGLKAPDGTYGARLVLLYRNDDRFEVSVPGIVLDTIAPTIEVSVLPPIFSPNGDKRNDVAEFSQKAQPGDDWTGWIKDGEGKTLRTWIWKNEARNFTWDGKDQAGNILKDGVYQYEASSTDIAGNGYRSSPVSVAIESEKKVVRLAADQRAFSPNADGVKDLLLFSPQVQAQDRMTSFSLVVRAQEVAGIESGTPVRTWKGQRDVAETYVWDGTGDSGKALPDGRYAANLAVSYTNGDVVEAATPGILLDRLAPKITVSIPQRVFSPNKDGVKDSVTISQNSVPGDDWTGRILAANGITVRTYSWKGLAKSFAWDGLDDSGKLLRDGNYRYEVVSEDLAGNKARTAVDGIILDAFVPKVYLTASETGISPNGDGFKDEVSFTLVVDRREEIESWNISLVASDGSVKNSFGSAGEEVPGRLVWDGMDKAGAVASGIIVGKLVVSYTKGDVAEATSERVYVDVTPPKVDVTLTPEFFSPDADGIDDRLSFGIRVAEPSRVAEWRLEVIEEAVVEGSAQDVSARQRLFQSWSGKGAPPLTIVWDGKGQAGELVESATDYPFSFIIKDALGNATKISGLVAVDVLVMREGDRLKIKVPSIVFRANHADFEGLDPDIIAKNARVIARIAQILNKFPDYRIRIEGHANNIGKMLGYSEARIASEETRELLPLSNARAELVRTLLSENGVDSRRLTVKGLGSSEPVVSFRDAENRWKNRRVEFILIKN